MLTVFSQLFCTRCILPEDGQVGQNMLYSTLNLWNKYKILLWLTVYLISLYVLPQHAVRNKGDRRHSFTYKNSVEICKQNTLILPYQVNPMWVTLLEYIYSYIQVLTLLTESVSRIFLFSCSLHIIIQIKCIKTPSNKIHTYVAIKLSWGYSSWGVKLTTHLHLVWSSRMCGAIPPLHQYGFMEW